MNLLWRFLYTYIFARFRTPVNLFDECVTPFRALPTDIDFLLHVNNGRYFSLTDVARTDLLVRSKTMQRFYQHKFYPVVASEMIRFKKSINFWQRFSIFTKIIGWDDKFLFFRHIFKRGDTIYALALIKVCFLPVKGTGIIPSTQVLSYFDLKLQSPVLPQWIKSWQDAEHAFNEEAGEVEKV